MKVVIPALFLLSSAIAQVVPAPQHSHLGTAGQHVGHSIHCRAEEFLPQARALADALQRLGVVDALANASEVTATVVIQEDRSIPTEGYAIKSEANALVVRASSTAGAAYAGATLLQTAAFKSGTAHWPRMDVRDSPDRAHRSFMVDMGRNPHSPKTLRHVVDMMWFYKANYLQLHLTDDQLFSWPSRAYPKLYSKRAGWTREDFVALEAYSQARGVTIIPEIEAPGHSTILRSQYPEIFGKTTTELAQSPKAQRGIEKLIAETLDVFKATPFVHIGGDEAYGVPETIQREFINRLNAFVRSTGRRTLVWEGPKPGTGDNKVSEDVVHINWRTINFPAQDMLDAGYSVVSAPWDPLYIVDHYPRTMFTAVDLERCFHFDLQRFAHINPQIPTFSRPHHTKTAEGILGFCMPWWEGREENLLPLCLPRLAAVAAAAWNREGEHDFANYLQRYVNTLPLLEKVSGFELPTTPYAKPESQAEHVAYRAEVTPSRGAHQPHFRPERLTNGITDRFDHFLGYPTHPEPLEITVELRKPAVVGRIVIYERAVGNSHEVYELLVSSDGASFVSIGAAAKGSRGEARFVEHEFPQRTVSHIRIVTKGCHGLTFPSFSRLSEVMAFAQ